MKQENTIIGYHGTKKENIQLICQKNFEFNNDKDNSLFLGYGVYFFYSYGDAIDWNIKKFVEDTGYLPRYKVILHNYGVIESKIMVESNQILDLDDKDKLYRLEILIEKFIVKFLQNQEYIRAKNKTAAIINILYNKKLLNKKVLSKTFIEQINIKGLQSFKNYPRKMFCVKDVNVIKENIENQDLSESLFESIIYFYK